MDPNYFILDYNRLLEILIVIILFSIFLERALSVIFESRYYIEFSEYARIKGFRLAVSKELISLIFAVLLCISTHLDAFTILLVSAEKTTCTGEIVTAMIVAGGSKASIKLFRDVLKIMSSAEKERLADKNNQLPKSDNQSR